LAEINIQLRDPSAYACPLYPFRHALFHFNPIKELQFFKETKTAEKIGLKCTQK